MKSQEFNERVMLLRYQRDLIKAMQRATAQGARVYVHTVQAVPVDFSAPAPGPALEGAYLGQSVAEDCLQMEADRIDGLLETAREIEATVEQFGREGDV